jgi:hypothetical protein
VKSKTLSFWKGVYSKWKGFLVSGCSKKNKYCYESTHCQGFEWIKREIPRFGTGFGVRITT